MPYPVTHHPAKEDYYNKENLDSVKERETESRLQINSSMPYPTTCPEESDLIKAKNGICQTQMDLNIY